MDTLLFCVTYISCVYNLRVWFVITWLSHVSN